MTHIAPVMPEVNFGTDPIEDLYERMAALHAGGHTHILRETMSALENRLPEHQFVRINRSAIVNVEKIRELEAAFHGDYTVVLRDGMRLNLTRGHREALRQLGID